ncbi:hypothetical protein [Streptomyces marincola]|uniref:hypothetical protein n=1 Tax=Streptomyces marincola TaxID=2878388 RepID=UPI001CF11305|nr:hypothetical protein [Streptomyces marincola]UCM87493.1 hypothetical protein LC193_05775 [Streptomyces marincola]
MNAGGPPPGRRTGRSANAPRADGRATGGDGPGTDGAVLASAAAAPPDALDELPRWRLRPGVAVTALASGVHLRGWITSVTLEGSPALAALWRHVDHALATDGGTALARDTPRGSPLRAAFVTLIEQLRAHDLLTARSHAGAGPAAPWLDTVAGRPGRAAAHLARTHTEVRAAERAGALARAAERALGGADRAPAPAQEVGPDLPAGQVLLTATTGRQVRAVAAGVRGGTGFVTPVGSPAQVRADARALAARLAERDIQDVQDTGVPPGTALTALVAAGAAQRLLCAAAGLRDPSAEAGDTRLLPWLPAVLIAEEEPLRGEYRTWPRPAPPAGERAPSGPAPRTLAEALARVPVLGDPLVGVLDEPSPGALPQLPVALAACAVPHGRLLAGAARPDLARLEALCRAAESRLGGERAGIVVGLNPGHARGRALRRAAGHEDAVGREDAARHAPAEGEGGGAPVDWRPCVAEDPQAGHWWSVLVRRLGARAELGLWRVGSTGAFRAVVRATSVTSATPVTRAPAPPPGSGRPLGTAVEATAADAVAFAALSAAVRVQARDRAADATHLALPSGALAPLAATGDRAPWEDRGWTSGWLAEVADREAALQAALAASAAPRLAPWAPRHPADGPEHELWTALHASGLTVLALDPAPGARHDLAPVGVPAAEGAR